MNESQSRCQSEEILVRLLVTPEVHQLLSEGLRRLGHVDVAVLAEDDREARSFARSINEEEVVREGVLCGDTTP